MIRKALELRPDDTDFAFNLGFALLVERDPAAAAFWLQRVVKQSPRDSHARALLSWALRRAGRTEEAELAAAHLLRAEKALQAGDPELGERELKLAAFSDPYNAPTCSWLG